MKKKKKKKKFFFSNNFFVFKVGVWRRDYEDAQ